MRIELQDEQVDALARLLSFVQQIHPGQPAQMQNKVDCDLLRVALKDLPPLEETTRIVVPRRYCTETISMKDSSDMTQYGICHSLLPCETHGS